MLLANVVDAARSHLKAHVLSSSAPPKGLYELEWANGEYPAVRYSRGFGTSWGGARGGGWGRRRRHLYPRTRLCRRVGDQRRHRGELDDHHLQLAFGDDSERLERGPGRLAGGGAPGLYGGTSLPDRGLYKQCLSGDGGAGRL